MGCFFFSALWLSVSVAQHPQAQTWTFFPVSQSGCYRSVREVVLAGLWALGSGLLRLWVKGKPWVRTTKRLLSPALQFSPSWKRAGGQCPRSPPLSASIQSSSCPAHLGLV